MKTRPSSLRLLDGLFAALQRHFHRARPGTVIIFVIVLLVLLALMGTAYLSTSRIDRFTAGQHLTSVQQLSSIDSYLTTAINMVEGAVGTITSGASSTSNPNNNASLSIVVDAPLSSSSTMIADRYPQLLPDNGYLTAVQTPPTYFTDLASVSVAGLQVPVYRAISRLPISAQAQSPLNTAAYGTSPISNYNHTDTTYWYAPTYVVITYPDQTALKKSGWDQAGLTVTPSLVGRTRVFPAFNRYSYSSGAWTRDNNGPYLAGDASGSGIADSALIPFNSSGAPLGSYVYYWSACIVDNAAAFNVNTIYGRLNDLDTSGTTNCNNWFPCDVDAMMLFSSALGNSERDIINDMCINPSSVAWSWPTPYYDIPAGQKSQLFTYTTAGDAYWHAIASRLDNEGYILPPAGGPVTLAGAGGVRPFGFADTASLAYHHGTMVPSPSSTASTPIEQATFGIVGPWTAGGWSPDSIFSSALNYVGNPTNAFSFLAANHYLYWFDWNYNNEAIAITTPNLPAGSGLKTTLGKTRLTATTGTDYFRNLRPYLVANNPSVNKVVSLDSTRLNIPVTTASAPAPEPMGIAAPAANPVKANLNTPQAYVAGGDQFPDLWRSFWNAMATPPNSAAKLPASVGEPCAKDGCECFGVPDGQFGLANTGTFRSTLRDPLNTNPRAYNGSGATSVLDTNKAGVRFDKYNMLLLRAAIAALNVEQFRNATATSGVSDLISGVIPNIVLSRQITLRGYSASAGAYANYNVMINGAAVQPYITEVFANNDTSIQLDSSGNKLTVNGNAMVNPKGYVAVELYNPYPFALSLKGYRLLVLDRHNGSTPNLPSPAAAAAGLPLSAVPLNDGRTTANLDAASIPAFGTVVLDNFYAPPTGTGADPIAAIYRATPPPVAGIVASVIFVPDLYKVMADSNSTPGSPNDGGELVLVRPHRLATGASAAADGAYNETTSWLDMVPCDSYDFTGLGLGTAANAAGVAQPTSYAVAWHYMRQTTQNSWKWVYPGIYNTGASTAAFATAGPIVVPNMSTRQQGTDWVAWATAPSVAPVYQPAQPAPKVPVALGSSHGTSSYTNSFPAVQTINLNFGGMNKWPWIASTRQQFPFGGFARLGDVIQVPFIGSYRVCDASGKLIEINSVTMDCSFSDDGDPNDDSVEYLGHFVPVDMGNSSAYNDYHPNGVYSLPSAPSSSATNPNWRCRWAMNVLNQFTVVNNPDCDYQPNCYSGVEPNTGSANNNGIGANYPVRNATGTTANAGAENSVGTEGLINLNTANWRVLSMIEMIPRSVDATGALNRQLAKLIVRYRDFDDGMHGSTPTPHGPFISLMELNKVYDPNSLVGGVPTKTFQNALGNTTLVAMLAGTQTPNRTWGAYTNVSGVAVTNDFQAPTLMVNRVSNMLTLRSDSFTCYVLVQQWRNVGTPFPELVAQQRQAMVIDRSTIPVGSFSQTTGLGITTVPSP